MPPMEVEARTRYPCSMRNVWEPDEPLAVRLTASERALLVHHTDVEGGALRKLEDATESSPGRLRASLTPSELNELLEWIAATLNHSQDTVLTTRLGILYDRLERLEDSAGKLAQGGEACAGPARTRARLPRRRTEPSLVNRCVVAVRPKEPFFAWLKGLPGCEDLTTEEITGDPSVYLLPVFDEEGEQARILSRFFPLIFEKELAAWWTDEALWPVKRDLRIFKRWFDVEFRSVVFDLVDAPLLDDL